MLIKLLILKVELCEQSLKVISAIYPGVIDLKVNKICRLRLVLFKGLDQQSCQDFKTICYLSLH